MGKEKPLARLVVQKIYGFRARNSSSIDLFFCDNYKASTSA